MLECLTYLPNKYQKPDFHVQEDSLNEIAIFKGRKLLFSGPKGRFPLTVFFLMGHSQSMRKFPDQEMNPSHSSDPKCHSDNAGSLTCCTQGNSTSQNCSHSILTVSWTIWVFFGNFRLILSWPNFSVILFFPHILPSGGWILRGMEIMISCE